mmetsp:Transcript_24462/g.68015  ORF Transcript_24462/g.68015 Transcript_24462/m.68015 type:complete len:312 (+) Transcript_24462:402-1337(+)
MKCLLLANTRSLRAAACLRLRFSSWSCCTRVRAAMSLSSELPWTSLERSMSPPVLARISCCSSWLLRSLRAATCALKLTASASAAAYWSSRNLAREVAALASASSATVSLPDICLAAASRLMSSSWLISEYFSIRSREAFIWAASWSDRFSFSTCSRTSSSFLKDESLSTSDCIRAMWLPSACAAASAFSNSSMAACASSAACMRRDSSFFSPSMLIRCMAAFMAASRSRSSITSLSKSAVAPRRASVSSARSSFAWRVASRLLCLSCRIFSSRATSLANVDASSPASAVRAASCWAASASSCHFAAEASF